MNNINWEQRRYEIAREVFAKRLEVLTKRKVNPKQQAENAVIYADHLINTLKREASKDAQTSE